ncbi:lipopolysaccharide biosynthesis protein [Jeotgalibaca sp. A122]|uniref:lipopolysaccharide biosynthesis protein n=1 Tax=Jeotgalibaca sp. A122 TaxID=3457322 RepID=UPI003FD41698
MNPYKKLLGNSALFAIGNLGSKLISIILVPLYTYYLTTSEYGLVDIVISTSSMLLPIISLSVYEAVLRFIMDHSHDDDTILTNGVFATIVGGLIILLAYPILSYFNVLGELLPFMVLILMLQALQSLLAQYTRSIGNIKEYALNGIIMSFVTGGMNILLLVYLGWGINGYLTSLVVSNIISILYLGWASSVHRHIRLSKFDLEKLKDMFKYSIPLIPNSFMWWIINASNRYFIYLFVGASANGLFAVANKIPSLLSILNTIFFQAWQLSAIEEFGSKDKSKLYSNVFNYFSLVMFMGTSAILIILKPLINMTVQEDFYGSWRLVPFLLLGVTFSSFSGFLGTNYVAAKETKGVFKTSVFGGIVSVITNFIFVPIFGANGAGISTMASFFVIWILRERDTRKYIKMDIDKKSVFKNLAVIALQIAVLYMDRPLVQEMIIESLLFIILLLINKKYLLVVFKLVKQMIEKKKGTENED